jgi:aryl-alcohol dehydrogenase-like predicted oxidoreductase
MKNGHWTRREAMLAGAVAGIAPSMLLGEDRTMLTRPIPASGEQLPVIGLGTYQVFDATDSPEEVAQRKEIVDLLIASNASVIDTSPMYNRSERMIGDVIRAGSPRKPLFIATKVWTDGRESGARQMDDSSRLMNTDIIDLMQVHNLRDTAVHMPTIRERQERGAIRYSGLTHYRADAHAELEAEMKKHRPDFIQINYSLGEREADDRLFPLATDLGIAVIVNRPYQSGALFRKVSGEELPGWAGEFASSWGQFFLKFILSHPAVTNVIPATSKLHHMRDNLAAGSGPLPDSATRRRMVDFMDRL